MAISFTSKVKKKQLVHLKQNNVDLEISTLWYLVKSDNKRKQKNSEIKKENKED